MVVANLATQLATVREQVLEMNLPHAMLQGLVGILAEKLEFVSMCL
jgi:hypothetical protein